MKILFLIIFIFLFNLASGQSNKEEEATEAIERILQNTELESEDEDIAEMLLQYFYSPLDMNSANEDELISLFILSELQIRNILAYRNTYGNFISIYELQAVPDLDVFTIRKILPFITIKKERQETVAILKNILTNENQYFLMRYNRGLEKNLAFANEFYEGNSNKVLWRYRNSLSKNFSFSITGEKDAGEKSIFNPREKQYGMDFISGHAALYNLGIFKAIVIGDFQFQSAQGLVFSNGFSLGKSAEAINSVRRPDSGIKPYTSTIESGFFRGVSCTIERKKIRTGIFLSSTHEDANVFYDSLSGATHITSLNTAGYHRNFKENVKRKNLRRNAAGLNISYRIRRNLQAGFNYVFTGFDQSFDPEDKGYNHYYFRGKMNYTAGVYQNYNWKNFNFFSEQAVSRSGGKAIIAGFVASLTSEIDFAFSGRNYGKNFHSFYGNGFGENSQTANEKGIYLGINFRPVYKINISAYYDRFKFPWLKYQVDAPSEGYEYLLRVQYRLSKKDDLSLVFKEESKEVNSDDELAVVNYLIPGLRRSVSFDLNKFLSLSLKYRSKTILNSYRLDKNVSSGYFMMHEIEWGKMKTKIAGRVSIFDSEVQENAFYVYERGVQYAFSIPYISGRGVRSYIIIRQKINQDVDIWLKYSRTKYYDREKIGSSMDEIDGNKKSEVTVQCRYVF